MNDNLRVKIRRATLDDAPELANVHLNAWREAYQGLLPTDYLRDQPLSFRGRMNWWRRAIGELPTHQVYVAETEKGIVGFSCFEPARDESCVGMAELGAIYLLEKFHGKRIGFDLLKVGMRDFFKNGFVSAYCWVLKDNPTVKFYEKTGAKAMGQTKAAVIGGANVIEIAYHWNDLKIFGEQYEKDPSAKRN